MDYYPPLSVIVAWRESGMSPEQIQESRIIMAKPKWTLRPKCGEKITNRWIKRHIDSGCEVGIKSIKLHSVTIPLRVIKHWRDKWGWTEEQIKEACQSYSNSWISRGG